VIIVKTLLRRRSLFIRAAAAERFLYLKYDVLNSAAILKALNEAASWHISPQMQPVRCD
jgi:glutaredoxin-related protein